jgi:two-component system, LuxR family, sensor kinase FixL
LHPDDIEKVYGLMRDHFNQNKPFDIEYRLKHFSGSYLWFHARGETLYDEKRKPAKLSGSIRDITEMKKAYSEIRKLTSAVEQSPLSIVITNIDGNIEYVNSEFTKVTGYEREEVLGKNPRILKSGTHTPNFYKDQWETILSGKVWKGIILNKSKEGVLFWESTSIAPIRDEQNKISHFVAVKENITERKEIEDRLIELSQSVEQSLSSIMITDTSGIIKYVNPAFVGITGYEFDEAIGKPPSILKSGKHSKSFYKKIWDTLLVGKSWEGEICNRKKNGTVYWEYECISPIKDSAGEINSYLSVRLDTTQRKMDEEKLKNYAEELQRSNESLGLFASIASHDLQEPLRKIITFGDRLKEKTTNLDATSYDYISRMQKSSFRMKKLIEDILSYSIVDSSPKQSRKIDLGQIINESLVNLEGRLEETKGVVKIGEVPAIEADPIQMTLMFQNLIGNSLKYHRTSIAPLVSISSDSIEGDRLRIIVKDNGIGMDMKFADKIFQPFQRLHGRTEYEGTGMGLAICKKIIDGHQGSISVESKLEEGSIFVITLPKKQSKQ